MRVGLLVTCLVDAMFPDIGKSTVSVLERLGVEVDVPSAQTCCGQMHINSGYPKLAKPLADATVRAFAGYDAVVVPSGSCAGSVRHQYRVMDDGTMAAEIDELSGRTYELSEFLVDVLGVTDVGAYFPHRVTYHPTCHSLRSLRVAGKPLTLLNAVRGIEVVDLPEAETCCGFGGTFALKNADVSTAMLADKMDSVRSTGAEVCVATDASCLMHIGGGLSRLQTGVRTAHLAEILAAT